MVRDWIISRGMRTITAINVLCVIGLLLLPLHYKKMLALFQVAINIIMLIIMRWMMRYAKKRVGDLY
jgi:energy-converting hydrogenase Eha subunit E